MWLFVRAGASTVSEIAAIGIPAVFIPFPFAVDDHQTENAIIMQKLGAAWVLQQKGLSRCRTRLCSHAVY